MVTYSTVSPKMVNPRNIAGHAEEEEEKNRISARTAIYHIRRGKFDLQFLSQCGGTSNCRSRSVPFHLQWDSGMITDLI